MWCGVRVRARILGVWGERRKTGVKESGIKFISFSFVLTLAQYAAKELMVREIKAQRTVVTFGNSHGSLGKCTL